MYLKNPNNGDLVEVLDTSALFDPNVDAITGRYHAGEEMQEAASFAKAELVFPSGEALPKCWVDPAYRG
ncbi:MAG: acetyltransferase [Pseudomonadota bacterium]